MPKRQRDVRRASPHRMRHWLIGGGLALALALVWEVTPLAEYAAPEALAHHLRELRSWRWTPLALMAVYVVSAAFMFPNTVLNVGTVLGIGGLLGAAYALAGSLLSAAVFYAVGRRLPAPRPSTRRGAWLKRAMDGVHASLADGRITSVVTLRILPVAPFTIVNIAAGAVRVPLRSYIIGSLLAFIPGIAAVALVGKSLRDVLLTPGPASAAIAVAAVLLSVAGIVLMRRRLLKVPPANASRARRTSPDQPPATWASTPPATAANCPPPSA